MKLLGWGELVVYVQQNVKRVLVWIDLRLDVEDESFCNL